jgi:hypothetical protein
MKENTLNRHNGNTEQDRLLSANQLLFEQQREHIRTAFTPEDPRFAIAMGKNASQWYYREQVILHGTPEVLLPVEQTFTPRETPIFDYSNNRTSSDFEE